MIAVLALIAAIWGLGDWTLNDTTLTPLNTALLCIAGLLAFIAAMNAQYGKATSK